MSKKIAIKSIVILLFCLNAYASITSFATKVLYQSDREYFLAKKLTILANEEGISAMKLGEDISQRIQDAKRAIHSYVNQGQEVEYIPDMVADLKTMAFTSADPILRGNIEEALSILEKDIYSVTGEEIIRFSGVLEVIVAKIGGDMNTLELVCKSCFANGGMPKGKGKGKGKMRKSLPDPNIADGSRKKNYNVSTPLGKKRGKKNYNVSTPLGEGNDSAYHVSTPLGEGNDSVYNVSTPLGEESGDVILF